MKVYTSLQRIWELVWLLFHSFTSSVMGLNQRLCWIYYPKLGCWQSFLVTWCFSHIGANLVDPKPEWTAVWYVGMYKLCVFHLSLPFSLPPYPHQSQALDVLQCVKEACSKGHLCLTIPWVVQYLSMMDSLALHSDYYKTLFHTLINIYRCVFICHFCVCKIQFLFSSM